MGEPKMISKHKLAVVMSGISGRINKLRVRMNNNRSFFDIEMEERGLYAAHLKDLDNILAELQEVLDDPNEP